MHTTQKHRQGKRKCGKDGLWFINYTQTFFVQGMINISTLCNLLTFVKMLIRDTAIQKWKKNLDLWLIHWGDLEDPLWQGAFCISKVLVHYSNFDTNTKWIEWTNEHIRKHQNTDFFLYHEFITKKQTIKYILLFCKDMYNNIGATSTENVSL